MHNYILPVPDYITNHFYPKNNRNIKDIISINIKYNLNFLYPINKLKNLIINVNPNQFIIKFIKF